MDAVESCGGLINVPCSVLYTVVSVFQISPHAPLCLAAILLPL